MYAQFHQLSDVIIPGGIRSCVTSLDGQFPVYYPSARESWVAGLFPESVTEYAGGDRLRLEGYLSRQLPQKTVGGGIGFCVKPTEEGVLLYYAFENGFSRIELPQTPKDEISNDILYSPQSRVLMAFVHPPGSRFVRSNLIVDTRYGRKKLRMLGEDDDKPAPIDDAVYLPERSRRVLIACVDNTPITVYIGTQVKQSEIESIVKSLQIMSADIVPEDPKRLVSHSMSNWPITENYQMIVGAIFPFTNYDLSNGEIDSPNRQKKLR